MRYTRVFGDFDFTLQNEVWVLNIHDNAENDGVIVIDFCYNDDEDETIQQMFLGTKEMLESILTIFFGFKDEDVKWELNEIEEVKRYEAI